MHIFQLFSVQYNTEDIKNGYVQDQFCCMSL